MLEPASGSLPRPQRPSKIVFEDRELAEMSRGELQELDIRGSDGNAPDVVSLILADFEGALRRVRTLADTSADVASARGDEPFGVALTSTGPAATNYALGVGTRSSRREPRGPANGSSPPA